jgi:hypothetical protein
MAVDVASFLPSWRPTGRYDGKVAGQLAANFSPRNYLWQLMLHHFFQVGGQLADTPGKVASRPIRKSCRPLGLSTHPDEGRAFRKKITPAV